MRLRLIQTSLAIVIICEPGSMIAADGQQVGIWDQGAKDSLETTSMSGVWPLGSDFRYVLYGFGNDE